MKTSKVHKAVVVFFVLVSFLSCKEEEDIVVDLTADLIGEWQRSDATNEFEYKLTFESNNIGFRIQREVDPNGNVTSSALGYEWSTNERVLTLDYGEEIETTTFSINGNGELLLSDITDLVFIKL